MKKVIIIFSIISLILLSLPFLYTLDYSMAEVTSVEGRISQVRYTISPLDWDIMVDDPYGPTDFIHVSKAEADKCKGSTKIHYNELKGIVAHDYFNIHCE